MFNKISSSLFSIFLAVSLHAQQMPAPPQSKSLAITGVTIHIGNGEVIRNGVIGFKEGKITLVSNMDEVASDRLPYDRILDAKGKHVYPGFIAVNTNLGLTEIEAVRATRDFSEVGTLNPNVKAIYAFNTDSKIPATVRSNGVLLAQVTPQGGRISGTSGVVELDGWNWEDAAYRPEDGVHLNWPEQTVGTFNVEDEGVSQFNQRRNDEYNRQLQELDQFFAEAKAYFQKNKAETKNLKFEAMRSVFNGKTSLYLHTNSAKSIMASVLFALKYQLRPVIVGGNDAWQVTGFLKENKVPVILQPSQRLPGRDDDDIDLPFRQAALLQEAGILFCHSDNGAWRQRNLPFQAGQSVGFGLDREAALSSITLNTAKILGIDKTVGSLEMGKDATLFISEGDALDMLGNQVTQAFIRGREIDLDNKQKELYRKYKTKYERQRGKH